MIRTFANEDALRALGLWGLHDARLERAPWGVNNQSWFVDTPSGDFVLRFYARASGSEVLAEHAFLRELGTAGLPFRTPRPVVALDGSSCPLVPGTATVAALFNRIAGEHPDDDDVAAVEGAGEAFAQLDNSLATRRTPRGSWDASIGSVHTLVPDLSSVDEIGAECADFVRRVEAQASRLRATLEPRQPIHGDFAFGNVLVLDGHVVGILDLEFLAEDARAAELAIALRLVLSKGSRDRIWRPLLRGYLTVLPLSDSEIAALPELAMHHEAVVVAWGLGMYRAGRGDRTWLAQHVERAMRLEPWLRLYATEVVDYAGAVVSDRQTMA